MQIFYLVYIPLLSPALIAIGTYALLLAWNEYLYAFLLLSTEKQHTVPVAMGYFLVTDDAPWSLLMATAIIYSLPPAAPVLRRAASTWSRGSLRRDQGVRRPADQLSLPDARRDRRAQAAQATPIRRPCR